MLAPSTAHYVRLWNGCVNAPKRIPKGKIREHPQRAELTLLDSDIWRSDPSEVHLFPSMSKAAKFLGTFSTNIIEFNMHYYKSKFGDTTYRIKILDPGL